MLTRVTINSVQQAFDRNLSELLYGIELQAINSLCIYLFIYLYSLPK